MIVSPPGKIHNEAFRIIGEEHSGKFNDYLELFASVDSKGRYLHYDSMRRRVPKGLDKELVWSVVKLARLREYKTMICLGEPVKACPFILTPTIQKAISETDRNATSAALEWMSSKVGETKHAEYLLNDLVEDEAISSSQLEGAATTTRVAKDLLKRKRKPRTPDEKMILGNFKMMKFAWDNRDKDLSIDLISELHQVGVEGIDDDKYRPGTFRNIDDDVVVEDGDYNVVYTPPTAEGLSVRLSMLSDWANTCHDDSSKSEYIPPLLKAITLHFAIGYEHPFVDGNGRVARSLFYWYMFKNDYAAFRYIAISVLLKSAPVQYGKSYLYTETDNMDLTYFIDHQCQIIIRAINAFKDSYKKTLESIQGFNQWLWESGLMSKLNQNQQIVFQVAKSDMANSFTAVNVKDNLGCSYNTASSVLKGLVALKIFKKEKVGREWVYSMLSTDQIKKNWISN